MTNKPTGTKQQFFDAYISLLASLEKPTISVQQLAQTASLHRLTFYKHFSNMDDFRQQCIAYYVEALYTFMKPLNYKTYEKGFEYDALIQLLTHILHDRETYKVLLTSEHIPEFNKELLAFFQQKIRKHTEEIAKFDFPGTNVSLEIVTWYGVSALFGTIIMWANANFNYSPEQLAQAIVHLTPHHK